MTMLDARRERTALPTTLRSPRLDPVWIGVLGFLVAFAFSWVPSLWFDEVATVSATTRTWGQLAQMLGNVDLVHGLYYAVIKVWFSVVGYSPVALRIPSAVAVGVAAALLVILVRKYGSRRLSILAGLVFLLLPRVTWMGTEGRSYAATSVLALAMTLAFLAASQRSGRGRASNLRWWGLYAGLAVLSSLTFLYLALLVVAHGVTALLRWQASGRRLARPLLWWAASAVAAAVVLTPFALLAMRQSAQVHWIGPLDATTWHGVFVAQWFYLNDTFAIVAWVAIAAGVVLMLVRRGSRQLLMLAAPWIVLPTVLLIAASFVGEPLYSARYVTFGAPAVAILMAVAVDALGRRRLIAVALALGIALTAPSYIQQRGPHAKQGAAWSEVADFFAAQRAAEPAGQADGIIWGPVRQHKVATSRVIEYAYPAPFVGTVDINLKKPAGETAKLWESRFLLKDVMDRFDGLDTVWLITSDKQDWRASVTAKLAPLGYHPDGEWSFNRTNVLRFTR
jgi:mannosyltransferase